MLIAALSQAISGTVTRATRELPFSVVIFAYGMFASAILFVYLFGDYCIFYWGKTPRIFTYSKEQYLPLMLCGFFSACENWTFTIAI